MIVAAISLVGFTWSSSQSAPSLRGYEIGIGAIALIVIAVTIVMVELRVQAGWIGAGFVFASLGRELLDARNSSTIDAGVGMWLATAAALGAALVLIIDIFLSVHENQV